MMKNSYILDKNLLEKRLKELSETSYTGEMSHGAMCYCPVPYMDVEYTCDLCGKTTEQPYGEIIKNLLLIRMIVSSLREAGYDVLLDESEYCQYCRENETRYDPEPIFKIRFNQNDMYHEVKTGRIDYYESLQAFLAGDDHYIDKQDFTRVLNDNIDIIVEMTGLSNKESKAWLLKKQLAE